MFWEAQYPKSGAFEKSPVRPILQRFPLATRQTSMGLESTKNSFSAPSIFIASLLRISSHSPAVFFLRSLNCLREMRVGSLSLYSCSLYSNNHFSLLLLSDSASNYNATTSKNFGIGPRRGILPYSLMKIPFRNATFFVQAQP